MVREFFFPNLMKAIGSYVSEKEAGERLAQVVDDPQCTKSGVYWSWNGNAPVPSTPRRPGGRRAARFLRTSSRV